MPDENGASRLDRVERLIENLSVNIESLHSSTSELYGIAQEQGRSIDKLIVESRQHGEYIRELGFRIENQRVNIESLHSNVSELHESTSELRESMSEFRQSMSEMRERAQELLAASRQDGEHIRALARIAEIHERRLSDLETGGEQ